MAATTPPIDWRAPVELPLLPHGASKPTPPDKRAYETFRVTSPYGWRPNPLYPRFSRTARVFHGGLDLGNFARGAAVVAAADGVVLAEGFLFAPWSVPAPAESGWAGGNYGGLMVVLEHPGAWVSIYAHLGATTINRGQRVKAGQRIGSVGDTGSAKGQAHLHLSIQHDGADVDPWPLVTAPDLSREERLAREVVELRKVVPPYLLRRVESWAGLSQSNDGKAILTRERRLAIEKTYLATVHELTRS